MDMLDDTIGAIDEDIVVTTTIDPRLQAAAERALTEELDKKGAKFGVSPGRDRLARSDGRDPRAGRRARLCREPVQPRGLGEAPAGLGLQAFRLSRRRSNMGSRPTRCARTARSTSRAGQPENYSHEYFGPVTLTKALALSLNTVAVRVGLEVGPKTVVKTAHRLGVQSELAAQRLDRARHVGGDAAGARLRLCALRQWRHRRAAVYHHEGEVRRRQAALQPQGARARPRHRSAICGA